MPFYTDESQFFHALETEMDSMFAGENTGHDKYHLIRTRMLALEIQKQEGGNRLVIGVAAFLHDIHRAMQHAGGRYFTPAESLDTVASIIDRVGGMPADMIQSVLHCVEYHEEYGFSAAGRSANDLETWIVQDSDNIDAMGMIGIARGFMYAGSHGVPMYLPELPLIGREDYVEGVNDPSQIHHFYSKLLRLKDNMNTETAKKLAAGRHQCMEQFLSQFLAEWNGQDYNPEQ